MTGTDVEARLTGTFLDGAGAGGGGGGGAGAGGVAALFGAGFG